MKGLIIKEFWLSLKYRIIVASAYALLLLLCILVRLSYLYGNIQRMKGKDMVSNSIFIIMALGLPAVLYLASFSHQIYNDEKCRFRQFSVTLPLSAKDIVTAEFISYLISFGAATVISWLNYFLACAVYGKDIDLKYLLYILIFGAIFYVFACFNLALAYRLRNSKKAIAIQIFFCMFLYFGGAFGFIALMKSYFKKRGYDLFSENYEDDAVPDSLMTEFMQDMTDKLKWVCETFWWFFIIVGAALVYFSYRRSIRSFERGGN